MESCEFCPFCRKKTFLSVTQERKYYTCNNCQRRFVAEEGVILEGIEVVQCGICGGDVEIPVDKSDEIKCNHCRAIYKEKRWIIQSVSNDAYKRRYCWRCKGRNLTPTRCKKCGWNICSCGACAPGCRLD